MTALEIILSIALLITIIIAIYIKKKKCDSKRNDELALRYQAIFNSISSGIEIRNKQGVIIDANEANFKLFGVIDRKHYLNAARNFNTSPNLSDEIKEKLNRLEPVTSCVEIDFDKINQTRYFKTSKSGKMMIEMKCMPMYNKKGKITGSITLSSDISENSLINKKYEDLYNKQEGILAMMPIGVEIYNPEGVLTYQNKVDQEIFGGDLTGKVNIFENPNLSKELIDVLNSGGTVRDEVEYDFDKLRELKYYETNITGKKYINGICTAIKDSDNKILFYICLAEDISKIVEAKKSLLENNIKMSIAINNSSIKPWDYYTQENTLIHYFEQDNNLHQSLAIRQCLEFVHPEDLKSAKRVIEIMEQGRNDSFKISIRLRSKEEDKWRYEIIAGEPFEYDKDGQVIKYTGVRKDITQEMEMTEKLYELNKQNKLILNNTQSGFLYFTPDYKVQWENVSRTFKEFDLAKKFESGITCHKTIKCSELRCEDCLLTRTINSKMISVQEMQIADQFIELIATPTFNEQGELEGVVMRVDNITEKKLTNIELQISKERAEKSNQLKSTFLANMSHEIRTPLNAIVGFSNIAMEAETPEEKEEYRKIISTNSDLLLNLINDILDLSKIESGLIELHPEKIDLTELFNEIYSSFSLRMKPEVRLECINPDKGIITDDLDKQRVIQVVTNFIANAIKFTSSGKITIGYKYENKGVKMYVSDTGIGISDENKHKVFNRFQKFDTFAPGTGLGLSICKAIVNTMNGDIGFESTEGEGSTFWVWVPCKSTSEEVPVEIKSDVVNIPQEQKSNKKNILVAEDNNSNYILLKTILKDYPITRAVNGIEVVEMAKEGGFDIILMDIKMPEMDGLEATIEIRKFNGTIPIIALTANAFDSDKEQAINAGCNDLVTKPINRKELFAIIENS